MLNQSTFKGEVYVIDEDATARRTLSSALNGAGYEVVCFADGIALLAEVKTRPPACIILESGIAERSGLEILRKLRLQDCSSPVLMTSANGDVPTAVDAIKSGAFDFIEKPFRADEIVARVEAAIDARPQASNGPLRDPRGLPDWEPLTPREREVLVRITAGETNKQAARQLGISRRTVEGHRASILRKVGVKNAAGLVRLILDQSRDS